MKWSAQYVIDPSGFIHWREGMRVTNPGLAEEFERTPIIGYTLGLCSEFGVAVGEA